MARSRGAATYGPSTPRTSPRAPPCLWTFLSSLRKSEFFSILLEARARGTSAASLPEPQGNSILRLRDIASAGTDLWSNLRGPLQPSMSFAPWERSALRRMRSPGPLRRNDPRTAVRCATSVCGGPTQQPKKSHEQARGEAQEGGSYRPRLPAKTAVGSSCSFRSRAGMGSGGSCGSASITTTRFPRAWLTPADATRCCPTFRRNASAAARGPLRASSSNTPRELPGQASSPKSSSPSRTWRRRR